MLVLSRKYSDKVVLLVPPSDREQRIEITVMDIDRGKIRLGIEAPRDIKIMRQELLGLQESQKEATP